MSKLYFITAKNGNSEIYLAILPHACAGFIALDGGNYPIVHDVEIFTLHAVDCGKVLAIEATPDTTRAIIDELEALAADDNRWIPLATINGTKLWCETIPTAMLGSE
ncbi:MAG: hypothetical protein ACRCWB_11800 [Enterovibrio sp.]